MNKKIIIISILFSLLIGIYGCSKDEKKEEELEEDSLTFFSMNTEVSISIQGSNIENALASARTRTLELENKWSVTIESSEVYNINHSEGNTVEVSDDTLNLIEYSLEIAKKTGGSFEPSIYPIVSLWGFTTREFYVPTDNEIEEALKYVGYEKVSISNNSVTLPKGMSLDFGAVGKGYALDEVITVLKGYNIKSGLVNFGGNIGLIGNNTFGDKFSIGVRDPKSENNLGTLFLSDCMVATSGNYQRFFEDEDGNRYGHIMNPVTGRPQESDILSVSVVADSGKLCDALATAIYVMGKDKAIQLWKDEGNFELLLITTDGKALITEGLYSDFTTDRTDLVLEKVSK